MFYTFIGDTWSSAGGLPSSNATLHLRTFTFGPVIDGLWKQSFVIAFLAPLTEDAFSLVPTIRVRYVERNIRYRLIVYLLCVQRSICFQAHSNIRYRQFWLKNSTCIEPPIEKTLFTAILFLSQSTIRCSRNTQLHITRQPFALDSYRLSLTMVYVENGASGLQSEIDNEYLLILRVNHATTSSQCATNSCQICTSSIITNSTFTMEGSLRLCIQRFRGTLKAKLESAFGNWYMSLHILKHLQARLVKSKLKIIRPSQLLGPLRRSHYELLYPPSCLSPNLLRFTMDSSFYVFRPARSGTFRSPTFRSPGPPRADPKSTRRENRL